jgi:hypothetical protein
MPLPLPFAAAGARDAVAGGVALVVPTFQPDTPNPRTLTGSASEMARRSKVTAHPFGISEKGGGGSDRRRNREIFPG